MRRRWTFRWRFRLEEFVVWGQNLGLIWSAVVKCSAGIEGMKEEKRQRTINAYYTVQYYMYLHLRVL